MENTMNIESNNNVVELFSNRPPICQDEDFLTLLEDGDDYIVYVRNYVTSQEVILVSNSIMNRLPVDLRPISNVLFVSNFHVIRQFKSEIRQYILLESSYSLSHFYHFFGSMTDFFDSL